MLHVIHEQFETENRPFNDQPQSKIFWSEELIDLIEQLCVQASV